MFGRCPFTLNWPDSPLGRRSRDDTWSQFHQADDPATVERQRFKPIAVRSRLSAGIHASGPGVSLHCDLLPNAAERQHEIHLRRLGGLMRTCKRARVRNPCLLAVIL